MSEPSAPEATSAPRLWLIIIATLTSIITVVYVVMLLDGQMVDPLPRLMQLAVLVGAVTTVILLMIERVAVRGRRQDARHAELLALLDAKAEDDRLRFGKLDRKLDVIAVGLQELGIELREVKEVTTGEIPRLRNVLDRYDQGYADGLAGRAAASNGRVTPIKRQVGP